MFQTYCEKNSMILGKWLWTLFWIVVLSILVGLLDNDMISKKAPILYFMGQSISVVCSFAYGIILIKISSEETHYRTAGICTFICAGINLLISILFQGSDVAIWSLILTIPVVIIGFIGEYNEYVAHSIVLTNVNNILAATWKTLWKWYMGLSFGIFGSLILLVIIPVWGSMTLVCTVVGVAVVGILKLVYLYKTAKVFRNYQRNKFIFME